MITTLPTDSNDRKNYALFRGCLRYFPAALAGVAKTSKLGNDKHNPGEEMHHARSKSGDHGDCIMRHLVDLEDLTVAMERGENVTQENILTEVDCMAWRALALSQELHEKFGAPLAPGAKETTTVSIKTEVSHAIELKKNFKFGIGDRVKHIDNDGPTVTVAGNYFDPELKPFLFIRDDDGKVFAVDQNFYATAPLEETAVS